MARRRPPAPASKAGNRPANWPAKHPWDKLPWRGKFPFVPPKGTDWPANPLRDPVTGGYVDASENVWIPHRPINPDDFHWDVQLPDGSHRNVRPDGEIHH